jgi:hypothetical protein
MGALLILLLQSEKLPLPPFGHLPPLRGGRKTWYDAAVEFFY